MIFEGLGALGSNVGVRGRFLVKKGLVICQIPHPVGGQFSMFFFLTFLMRFLRRLQAPKITEHWSKSNGFFGSHFGYFLGKRPTSIVVTAFMQICGFLMI